MRTIVKSLTSVGCLAAALLLVGPVHGQGGMSGGSGSYSGGGGGGGGGSSSGGSGSGSSDSSNSNFSIAGQSLQTSIGQTPSTLNSFNNVGTGSTKNGAVSSSNPLAAYYYNPLAQGLITTNSGGTSSPSNVAFGAALYGNMTGGSGSGTLGGKGSGSAFGGSSGSGLGSFGGSSSSNRSGSSSLSGTATIRGGSTNAVLFTGGGSYGPANGRRGPVMGFGLRGPTRIIPLTARQVDLQQMLARSTAIAVPGGIIVTTNGNAIVLTGTVASDDERRIAENVLRLSPGVSNIQNNLTVGPPPGPGPTSPAPGANPGPNPIAPPPGT